MDFVNKIRILPTDEAVEFIKQNTIRPQYKEPLMKMVNVLFYSDWNKAVEVYKAILKKQSGSINLKEHKFIEKRFFINFVEKGIDVIDVITKGIIYDIAFQFELENDSHFWTSYVNKLDLGTNGRMRAITMACTHFKENTSTAIPRALFKKFITAPSAFNTIYIHLGDPPLDDWVGITRLLEFIVNEYKVSELDSLFIGMSLIPMVKVGDKIKERTMYNDGAILVWTEANKKMLEKILASNNGDYNTHEIWEKIMIDRSKNELEKLLKPGVTKIFKNRNEWEELESPMLSQTQWEVLKNIMLSKEQDRKEYLMITVKAMYRQLSQIMGQGTIVQVILDMFLMTANNWKEKLTVYKGDNPYKMLLDLFLKLDKEAVKKHGDSKKARTSAGHGGIQALIRKIVNDNNL